VNGLSPKTKRLLFFPRRRPLDSCYQLGICDQPTSFFCFPLNSFPWLLHSKSNNRIIPVNDEMVSTEVFSKTTDDFFFLNLQLDTIQIAHHKAVYDSLSPPSSSCQIHPIMLPFLNAKTHEKITFHLVYYGILACFRIWY